MRSESQASQRAVVLKLTLATIAEHPRRLELEAAFPAELREAIEAARPSEWVPVTRVMQTLQVLWDVLGRDGLVEFYRLQSARAQADSTIGRLLAGVTNLLNPSPTTRLRHLQRGFDLIQRDIGDMRVDSVGDSECTFVLEGLAPVLRNPCYASSFLGALEFAIQRDNDQAFNIEMDLAKLDRGRIDYRISWHDRAAA